MLAFILAHPYLTRLMLIVVSLFVAWLINWAIITQAYKPRAIGAWSQRPATVPSRTWLDWIPVLGWWRLRRESSVHGARFWLRPFLIELLFPLGMLWLYDAHVSGKLLPAERLAAALQAELHCQFIGQYVLIALMTVATFIDFDEHMIPDTIVVPGTVLGLVGSASLAAWFPFIPFVNTLEEMHAASISSWPDWLNGTWGLAISLLIICGYCFGLLDRVWITRRGLRKAVQYFFAMVFRSYWWLIVLVLWLVLVVGTVIAWQASIIRWQFLLSAYMGLACAGGYTWLIRLAAKGGLGVEALGFGDVTLMAMIGVYLGWQPSILVFFVAPFFACVIFGARKLLFGVGAGPYGPYLSMAAAFVLINWEYFRSTYAAPILELPPWMTLSILVVAVILMWGMLGVYRMIVGKVQGVRQLDT